MTIDDANVQQTDVPQPPAATDFGNLIAQAVQSGKLSLNPQPAAPDDYSTVVRSTYIPADPSASPISTNLTPPAPAPIHAQIMRNADVAASAAPDAAARPGGWARALLSGLSNTLSGLGDVSTAKTEPGQGFLAGIVRTEANRNARLQGEQEYNDKMAQQAKENERQDTTLDLDRQRTAATIAAANAEEILHQKASRDEDFEYQKKSLDFAKQSMEPLTDAGANILASNLDSDALRDRLQTDKGTGHTDLFFQDGWVPVVGSDGKPQLDKDGSPLVRATWSVLSPPPQVTLTQKQADFLNKYGTTPQPVKEGQEFAGVDYYYLAKRAQTQEVVQNSADKVQAEIAASQSETERNKAATRNDNLSIQEKEQNQKAKGIFGRWLAAANGDPVIAMQLMSVDPKDKANIGAVEQLYGPGSLEKVRQDTITDLEKTIDENEKILAEHAVPGATPLPEDEEQDLKQEISAAQGKRNTYLGLHPADPPAITDSVAALDKIPASQRYATILGSTTMPNAAKIYLLKHYGLQVPPQLSQPAPVAAPAR